jgi:hypothetical protein
VWSNSCGLLTRGRPLIPVVAVIAYMLKIEDVFFLVNTVVITYVVCLSQPQFNPKLSIPT